MPTDTGTSHTSKSKRSRRKLTFGDWDAVVADAVNLHERGYDRVGNLNLGQICNHLAIILEGAVNGFPSKLPWIVQMILRPIVLPGMLKHKPISVRAPAPGFADPNQPVEDQAGLDRLKAAVESFTAHSGEYQIHPAFGTLTRDQWHHQQLWHCEHHLSFLLPSDGAQQHTMPESNNDFIAK
jgi:hypothetical protein